MKLIKCNSLSSTICVHFWCVNGPKYT